MLTGSVGAAQLAKMLGISTRRLRELAESGVIPRVGGRYCLPDSISSYCAHLREIAAGRVSQAGGRDLIAERARLAAAQADRSELELAVRRGELVNAAELKLYYTAMVKAAVGRLRGVPSKAKGRLPQLDAEAVSVMEHEIDVALRGIAVEAEADE